MLFNYHAKPVMLRPTLEPGHDTKDPRLAAIPEKVTARAEKQYLLRWRNFRAGFIAVRRNSR